MVDDDFGLNFNKDKRACRPKRKVQADAEFLNEKMEFSVEGDSRDENKDWFDMASSVEENVSIDSEMENAMFGNREANMTA